LDRDRVDGQVVREDQGTVRAEGDVELDGVDADGQGVGEARQRILRPQRPGTAVAVDLRHWR
jgi:hypothetical protein